MVNPVDTPIDGLVLGNTVWRSKSIKPIPYLGSGEFNHGGIEGPVELLVVPAVWVEDAYVRPDPKTGAIRVEVACGTRWARPYRAASR